MNANSRLQVQYSIPRHILAQVNHGPGTGPRMERQSVRLTPPLTTEAQARTAASIAPSSPGFLLTQGLQHQCTPESLA